MNLWALIAVVLPLLPILAAFRSLRTTIIGIVVTLAAYGSVVMLSPGDIQISLLATLPLLAATATTAVVLVRSREESGRREADETEAPRRALEARHAVLKEAVAKGEAEERLSLSLYGAAKSLAESLSWKDMSPRLTSAMQKVFGAYEYILYAVDENGAWSLLQRRGNWVKEPPIVALKSAEAAFVRPPETAESVPVLAVPILAQEEEGSREAGVLFLKSGDQSRTEEDLLATGREFGPQLAVGVAKAILFAQIERQSRVDGMTGTLRRLPFMERFEEELKRAAAFNTPFSVLMVDIDHFKAVNDTHGHAAGDAVLARVGQILRDAFYETDVVGRYGGEEFIVLLPRAETDGVMRKAESLRKRFESETIAFGFEQLKITVSIGLAHFPRFGRTAEELIASADHALYAAKEGGRNRVVMAA